MRSQYAGTPGRDRSNRYGMPASRASATRRDGRFVVVVVGELDITTTEELDLDQIVDDYRSDEPLDISVDLTQVTFTDSTGLSWLMRLRSAAALANRRVRLRGVSPQIDRVLQTSGLRKFFPDEEVAAVDGAAG